MIDDDYKIIKSVIDGKTRDYELLVKKYQLRIISLCQKYTKNYHDAEEVSQEAFVKAFNSLGNFRFESKFYSWLHRIAINCSLNYINSKEKNREKETISENSGLTDKRISEESPDSYLELENLAGDIKVTYDNLSTDLREVFRLSDIEGLSYEEISNKMNIPIGTVRSRLHRARETLLRIFNNKKYE